MHGTPEPGLALTLTFRSFWFDNRSEIMCYQKRRLLCRMTSS